MKNKQHTIKEYNEHHRDNLVSLIISDITRETIKGCGKQLFPFIHLLSKKCVIFLLLKPKLKLKSKLSYCNVIHQKTFKKRSPFETLPFVQLKFWLYIQNKRRSFLSAQSGYYSKPGSNSSLNIFTSISQMVLEITCIQLP